MNTLSGVSGFGALDLNRRPLAPAGAAEGGDASRWLDGLDTPGTARLSVELATGTTGLSAAEHAQRVLTHLLADGS
ncbi:MAG TPA: hypothetical protein VGQ91_02950 [Ideonella sp.]|jgi:hypothetical protein|nr:hypothetical protein [Ideonella sp.]